MKEVTRGTIYLLFSIKATSIATLIVNFKKTKECSIFITLCKTTGNKSN